MTTVADLIDSLLTHFDPSDVLYSVNLEGTDGYPGKNIQAPYNQNHETTGTPVIRRLDTGETYPNDYDSYKGYAPSVLFRKAASTQPLKVA